VLTVSNGQYPAIDKSLLEQIPKSAVVVKSRLFEPYDIYRFLTRKKPGSAIDVNVIKKESQKSNFLEKFAEFIRGTFFIPDARMAWRFTAPKAINEIQEKYKIDAVYSSSPPYTCSIIARNFKRKTGVPWVAGFRDPWRGFISAPKRWFLPDYIDKIMERSVFKEADAVECAWEGIIKDALRKYPDLPKEKFHHVPNGFDSSDFPQVEKTRNTKFTITYTGSMYGRRNPASFFSAIDLLLKRGELDSEKTMLRFIGRFGAEVEQMFNNSSFKASIEIINYIPHQESIKYLLQSDALLLVVDESKESEEIVPGKVYEYIGCKKPIIAIAPTESAISRLIAETRSGKSAHQQEIEKIADIIKEYYLNWKNNDLKFLPEEELINKFERRESARMLAEMLDGLV
jgi:hypothetical protein